MGTLPTYLYPQNSYLRTADNKIKLTGLASVETIRYNRDSVYGNVGA